MRPILVSLVLVFSAPLMAAQTTAIDKILKQNHGCSATIVIRSQNLSEQQVKAACQQLSEQESDFHRWFNSRDKPVKNDHNLNLRVNVYQSREDFVQYAAEHFNMPTNNGGMYLEGFPDKPGNQAEFITYQRGEVIWNLQHEYVHYLDGRFNLYGDFCASLHDSHSPPENCPSPAPLAPHTVWWAEGVAEFIANGTYHKRAFETVAKQPDQYQLSQLFDTSYEQNGGGDRVYSWGYFAVRYMLEQQRDKVESMLIFTRTGDFPRYQALIRSWGTSMDPAFKQWLAQQLAVKHR